FEITATGFWPGQAGFTSGLAAYPLYETNFHELGQYSGEWAFRARDGKTFVEGVAASAGSPVKEIGDRMKLEYDTESHALKMFVKRLTETDYELVNTGTKFTNIIPAEGKQLRFAVSTVCWQPCGLKIVNASVPRIMPTLSGFENIQKVFG